MYSQWLHSNWATEESDGSGFKVGHDFDTCTDGAWIRLFRGRGGQPLPGTDCSSVVLIDTQGLAKGVAAGVHRLFALALLLSSTVSLNVMRQFNDDTLERLGTATAHATSLLRRAPFGEHSPNMVVLLRDARLRMSQVCRLMMLRDDLRHLEEHGTPPRDRPFHASFVSAAEHLTSALQPKIVGNAFLSGEMLATTASSLVDQLNQGVQLSLSSTVDALRHEQASQAVAAGLRAFRTQLPEMVRGVGAEDTSLNGAALALSPAAVAYKLRNATEAAVAAFAKQAPNMGSRERLQPYVEQLRISVQAMQRELKQAIICCHLCHVTCWVVVLKLHILTTVFTTRHMNELFGLLPFTRRKRNFVTSMRHSANSYASSWSSKRRPATCGIQCCHRITHITPTQSLIFISPHFCISCSTSGYKSC
ncbi:MAG: hypothetical protein SGPRY_012112 [Prymnesium sp.]